MTFQTQIEVFGVTDTTSHCDISRMILPHLGIAKTCTHLYPAQSTSTQIISTSATPLTLLEPQYRMQLGNFPKLRPENSKLSDLTEN